MPDIFISYSQKDKPWVSMLATALEEQGYAVWWDLRLRSGERADEVIWQNLEDAQCVIVVWSKDAFASEWVRDEAGEARVEGKLIPIRLDDVKLHAPFWGLQTGDFCQWKGGSDSAEFRSLLESIDRHTSLVRSSLDQSLIRECYIDNKDGTVTDIELGLMWKQHSEIDSHGNRFTWMGAERQAIASKFAGYSDWRIPSIDELKSLLVSNHLFPPYIDEHFFPRTGVDSAYWSNSKFSSSNELKRVIKFNNEYEEVGATSHSLYLRLVRDVK